MKQGEKLTSKNKKERKQSLVWPRRGEEGEGNRTLRSIEPVNRWQLVNESVKQN